MSKRRGRCDNIPALTFVVASAVAIACASPYPRPPDTDRQAVVDTIHGVTFVDHNPVYGDSRMRAYVID